MPTNDADSGPLPPQPIGEVRVRQKRDVWLVSGSAPLRCGPTREYHRFEDALSWNDGGLRCNKRMPAGGECDRLVYFLGGNFHDARGIHRMFIVAHVTPEEMRYMREQRMLFEQAIEYLGIGLLP